MRIFKVLVVLFAISFSNGLSLHGEEVVLQKVKKTIYFDWTFGARAGFGPSITWNFDDRIAMQAAQMVGFSSGYNSTTFGGLYYLSEGFSTIYTGLYYQNYYSSEKAGTITKAKIREIAEKKMKDLNANDVEAAMKIIEGSARSMGVDVK
jgi:hypothetical protein